MRKPSSSDGWGIPMNRTEFFHWMAKHGAMPIGAMLEDYREAEEIAWAAYKRGRSDQRRIEKAKHEPL